MNIEHNNATENEVEYVEKTHTNISKFKKYEILIFIGCIAFAFMMWCYANFLDDPIIQKDVRVYVDVFDGDNFVERLESKISIYGEESVISKENGFYLEVGLESFGEDKKTQLTVKLPEDVYSHDNKVEVELKNNNQ